MDTPPALNVLTVNAYVMADGLIIPMAPEILSLLGVAQIRETIDTVRRCYNSRLKVLGILLNKFNGRLTLSKDILELAEEVAGQLGSKVFQTRIHRGVGVAMAPAHGQTVLTYQPDSRPAQDFLDIVDAVAGDRFPRPKPTFRQKYISKFFN